MNRILGVTLICAAMALSAGCKGLSLRPRSDKEPSQAAEQNQIKKLQDEVATLKDRIAIRDLREKELRKRGDTLAENVRQLEFVNQQQENQIKVLSQAPLARDEYKALAEQLKTSLERVTARLASLEATNKLLMLHLKMTTKDEPAAIILPTTAPAILPPTTKPSIILPTIKPATVLPTTVPARVSPMPPPATVLPTSKIRRGGTGPVTAEPAPGEEY